MMTVSAVVTQRQIMRKILFTTQSGEPLATASAGMVILIAMLLLYHNAMAQQTTPPETPQATQQKDPCADDPKTTKKKDSGRIFGIIPAFNVTSADQTRPMTSKEKLHLALKTTIEPAAFVRAAFKAGVYQANNVNPGFGQEASGYAKRFGASFADGATGKMLGVYFFPTIFHQEPRYFRKGQGSFKSRLGYSLTRVVITRTDAGGSAFNWSKTLSSVGSGAISNLYYPDEDRGAGQTFRNAGWSMLSEAGINVLKEFWPDIQQKLFKKCKK
jgi:hypothetical protein